MYKIDRNQQQYRTQNMDKAAILKLLKKKGCRITRQRELLLDIILQGNCTSCKEVYFIASKKDGSIGLATIYRLVNLLEEIGTLRWRSEYQICEPECQKLENCYVELEDASRIELHSERLKEVLERGMETCGYTDGKRVKHVLVRNI